MVNCLSAGSNKGEHQSFTHVPETRGGHVIKLIKYSRQSERQRVCGIIRMVIVWTSGIRNTGRFYQSFSLSICLSTYPPTCHLSLYLSMYLHMYVSNYLSSIHLSIHLSTHLSLYLCIYVYMYLSIIYLSTYYLAIIYLYIYVSTYLSSMYLYLYPSCLSLFLIFPTNRKMEL